MDPRFYLINELFDDCYWCTGGRHRSVYLVDHLAHHYRQKYSGILVRHRELAG